MTMNPPAPSAACHPAIDLALHRFVKTGQVAGVVAGVATQNRVLHASCSGMADIEHQRPMTMNSLFFIASMTKLYTAVAIHQLAEQGRLRMDDPVADHLPCFANLLLESGQPPHRPITIRDLITHTSGLTQIDTQEAPSLDDAMRLHAAAPLAFEPGSAWLYGPGFSVAGRIVEVLADQPLDAYFQQHIFAPLGMDDTAYQLTPTQCNRVAKIYQQADNGDGFELAPIEQAPYCQIHVGMWPSAGLMSTLHDQTRFAQMLLNRGQHHGRVILQPESIDHICTLQTQGLEAGFLPGSGWGLGFCLICEPQGVTEALSPGSFGGGGAFGTQLWVDPTLGLAYILLVQASDLFNSDGSDLRREFQNAARQAFGHSPADASAS